MFKNTIFSGKRIFNRYINIMVLSTFLFLSSSIYAAPIEVFVSILPQQYIVERIGGELVNVNVMVKPGQSPETFEPSPKMMSLYSSSDVYFTIGLPFEQVWIDRVASLNDAISIVQTQASSEFLIKEELEHHGHEAHHSWDPHTWLSPVMFLEQAKIVLNELKLLSPKNKSIFLNNYNKLEEEVKVINNEFLALFKLNNKKNFITFHPAFSYFAKEYGLTQISIEVEGKEPSAKQIAQVIDRIKNENVSYILIEKQFNQVIPKTIAKSVGAQLLILDPLALDYFVNMRDIAHKINKGLF
ncbi:MAG: zinc ABC transporter substrate-binding protein [Gammaproteobacteria bacterium]|nr:zinc ABC transporter substrate-binding protein [Gammaproteobacteria bacterium]